MTHFTFLFLLSDHYCLTDITDDSNTKVTRLLLVLVVTQPYSNFHTRLPAGENTFLTCR
jgi:hypothetical protein